MPDETPTRADVAAGFEEAASAILRRQMGATPRGRDAILVAQLAATLALSQRVADLTDRLREGLGDDSNLDEIVKALRAMIG